MREFFIDEIAGMKFELFGPIHFMCLIILFAGLILIFINQDKISKISKKTANKIKWAMLAVWFTNRCIYMGSYMYYGVWSWKEDLPLHFCFVTGYLFLTYIITKKKDIFKLVYFFVFAGPLTATIWPDLVSSFDYYVFYEFFISHHLFILFVFFTFYMDNIKIEKYDILKALVWSNLLFIFAIVFNGICGTNYIMSKELPEHIIRLYPFVKYFNYPIIILEVVGIAMLWVAYIPVYLKNKKKSVYNN